MSSEPIELSLYRRFYAEEIAAVSHVRTTALVDAFAAVPRERFLGPGPWQVAAMDSLPAAAMSQLTPGARYRTTTDADPRRLYHNVVVAIDASRMLNNGQPGALALWLDHLELRPGDRVLHIGCGVGYYTAIIAETVGVEGSVLALEIDAALAQRARANLTVWPRVQVLQTDGSRFDPGPVDVIFVNAGVTHPQSFWLDRLTEGGRLLLPLTASRPGVPGGVGFMVKVGRRSNGFAAQVVSGVAIYDCVGGRREGSNQRIQEALQRLLGGVSAQSLRLDAHEPTDSCWLHDEDYCLSTLGLGGPGSVS